ncbi:MAG: single-stranded DNA-binding protein [Kiritimatiellae bacterium]|nr:single-stranded DNA-binding protein [Kiritimatiellia bacterium]
MLNKVFLMGRLTRNPELRHTQSGTPVASFSIAVDRDFKSQNGEKDTDFINIVAWRNTAEFVSKYFTKGRMAVIEGRLQIRDWTDKHGTAQRTAEVVADNIYFGDSKKDTAATTPVQQSDYTYSVPSDFGSHDNSFAEIDDDDGDLPF